MIYVLKIYPAPSDNRIVMKSLIRSRTSLIPILLVLAICLMSAGCGLIEAQPDGVEEERLDSQVAAESLSVKLDDLEGNRYFLEQRIHELVNQKRVENGLGTLQWEERLAEIARYHSQDMADRDYFDHLSPEGEDFSARYAMFGYDPSNRVGDVVYLGAENLFLNNLYESYTYNKDTGEVVQYDFNTLEQIAVSTVEGWMNSEGHRVNLLMPHFKKEGIGVVFTDDGRIYISENFS